MFGSSSKKHLIASVIAIFVLSGCSGLSQADIDKLKSLDSKTIEQIVAGLKFSSVSEQNAALFNQNVNQHTGNNGNTGAVATAGGNAKLATAPAMESRNSSMAYDGATASMIAPRYFPQPGFFQEYVVIDFEEAKKEGYKGTYLSTLNDIIKPIIKGLAPDARLVNSNGNTDEKGVNLTQTTQDKNYPEGYFGTYQWYFNFVSSDQKEVYNINVSEKETLVIRQKWGLKDLNISKIEIDSSKAIEIALNSIKDQSAKPSYDQIEDSTQQHTSKILYAPPTDLPYSWNFYLEQDKEGLVWNINLTIFNKPNENDVIMYKTGSGQESSQTQQEADKTQQQPEKKTVTNIWYDGGFTRISAETGKVLSFSRPMKHTNTYETYTNIYQPTEPMRLPLSAATGTAIAVDAVKAQ